MLEPMMGVMEVCNIVQPMHAPLSRVVGDRWRPMPAGTERCPATICDTVPPNEFAAVELPARTELPFPDDMEEVI